MKKIILLLFVFLLNSCSNFEEQWQGDSNLIAKWVKVYDDRVNADGSDGRKSTYNPIYDNYYSASFLEFTKKKMNTYGFSRNDELVFKTSYDYDVLENKIGTLYSKYDYKFDANELILLEKWYIGDELQATFTTRYQKYHGDFPPDSLVAGIQDDDYEPDDTYQTATELTIDGEWQIHSAITSNRDWFSFNAEAGERYILRVNTESADLLMRLVDKDGITLMHFDDNDEGNHIRNDSKSDCVIVWDCVKSGKYYFNTVNRYDYYSNYYAVSINNTRR